MKPSMKSTLGVWGEKLQTCLGELRVREAALKHALHHRHQPGVNGLHGLVGLGVGGGNTLLTVLVNALGCKGGGKCRASHQLDGTHTHRTSSTLTNHGVHVFALGVDIKVLPRAKGKSQSVLVQLQVVETLGRGGKRSRIQPANYTRLGLPDRPSTDPDP
jgi:hypothetical protein